MYVLKDVEPRVYQQVLAASAITQNTLVVLPTGLGKTMIALLTSLYTLNKGKKVMMVAPTKPLVQQHEQAFFTASNIPQEVSTFFTGNISPEKREILFKEKDLIFSTPQAIENDIVSGRIKLNDVGLLIIDEAHRATGNYSYVWLVRQLFAQAPAARVLGLTASPGTDKETIEEVCTNLRVDAIEYRSADDHDVKPYLEETQVTPMYVQLPEEFDAIRTHLRNCFIDIINSIKRAGVFKSKAAQQVNKKDLLLLQGSLRKEMAEGNFDKDVIAAISQSAMAIKVMHAQELIESQGLDSLQAYFADVEKQVQQKASKAVVQLMSHPQWRIAMAKAKVATGVHPKMHKLHDILIELFEKKSDAKAIIFSQYRSTLQSIHQHLSDVPDINARLFVGQAKKNGTGMSQKEQKAVIGEFSTGGFNVACMSSVGEEGLDIPVVDLVVFYEPIPSAIRSIQRRGRTGRHASGNVIMLIAKGTKDEAYRWVAHHKEKNMYKALESAKKNLKKKESVTQSTLTDISSAPKEEKQPEQSIKIYADTREQHNVAIKILAEKGVEIKIQQLAVGDIILSQQVAVEYKKTKDFVDSILDGRLLEQIKELKQAYPRPLVLIEGDDLFSVRNVHPNAIMGMLSTIAVSYGIPILSTKNAEQTALLLHTIARREQQPGSTFSPHASKKPKSMNSMIEYTVASIPGVGLEMSKRLLKRFGTIKQLAEASVEQLEEVDGVGKKTASDLYLFFRTAYK